MDTTPYRSIRKRAKQRPYLVARGGSCILCKVHDWRAFRDPEDKDRMSPCTRLPIYSVLAVSKQEAVALVRAYTAALEDFELI